MLSEKSPVLLERIIPTFCITLNQFELIPEKVHKMHSHNDPTMCLKPEF